MVLVSMFADTSYIDAGVANLLDDVRVFAGSDP